MIVDGKDAVFGRLASRIAKKLLEGEEVHLINAEKIILTGNPKAIVERFLERRRVQHKGTPEYSPKWPKVPNLLVRRMIRGMLPFKKAKGKAAYRRLKVYIGDPNLKGDVVVFEDAKKSNIGRYITIEELCKHLGW